MRKKIAATLAALVMGLVFVASPATGSSEKVTICHAAGLRGTTHYVTLTIGYNAVYGPAGHFFENGTPRAGHEEDYLGPCLSEPTPTASPQTPTPIPTTQPSASVTPTPSSTPRASETPSPTPTASAGESTAPTPSTSPSLTPTTTSNPTLPPTDTAETIDTLAQVALTGLIVYLALGIIGVVGFVIAFTFILRRLR